MNFLNFLCALVLTISMTLIVIISGLKAGYPKDSVWVASIVTTLSVFCTILILKELYEIKEKLSRKQ